MKNASSRLALFLRSPLGRHPGLLARKVVARLSRQRPALVPLSPTAPSPIAAYPRGWGKALREISDPSRTTGARPGSPRPFHRVFDHDFDEEELLALCRTGPRRGEKGLTGDIKLIWDYSRGHPLWPNAINGYADYNAEFIRRWLAANADLSGPAWSCAMDVAIRAVNWIFADVIADGRIGAAVGRETWNRWLWEHGRVTWRRLEAMLNSSNHYLADLLGLAVIGSTFPQDPAAQHWRRFAAGEFPRALLAQTRADGGLNEASLRYHAFVTEMALLTRLALEAPFPPRAEERLTRMCQVLADARDAGGDVFALGDDDSGRVLWLNWDGTGGRADAVRGLGSSLLKRPFNPSPEAFYPDSGWWVVRTGEFVGAVEFGGVGLHGHGAHAHNDDLSFVVEWRGHPIIVDPGTYLYTSDPGARNSFRSVRAHNTICVDGQEPRRLTGEMFHLPGDDAPAATQMLGPASRSFKGTVRPGLTHSRRLEIRPDGIRWFDRIDGTGPAEIEWRFHLHPRIQAQLTVSGFILTPPDGPPLQLQSSGTAARCELRPAQYSPSYGVIQDTRVCVVTEPVTLPVEREFVIGPGRAGVGSNPGSTGRERGGRG